MAKAITRNAAAAELDCSPRTIDRLRASGELDWFELSEDGGGEGGVRIPVASIDALIERRTNAARRRTQGGSSRSLPGPARVDVANVRGSLRKARQAKAAERRG